MKVFLVNAFCPPYAPGGAEFSMVSLAERLVAAGVDTCIVAPSYGHPIVAPKGVRLISINSPLKLKPGQDFDTGDWLQSENFERAMMTELRSVWQEGDVIHLQGAPMVPIGVKLRRLGYGPVILTVRDTAALCPSGYCLMMSPPDEARACSSFLDQLRCAWKFTQGQANGAPVWRSLKSQPRHWANWRKSQILRAMMNELDGLITVSSGFARILLANGVGSRDNLLVVYNSPPSDWNEDKLKRQRWLQELGLNASQKIILLVGKRSFGKGTFIAWEAMQDVHAQEANAVLVSVGKGVNMPATDFWINHGSVPQDDLPSLYALATAVLVPSIWPEPFSRVLLEAMVARKPIIGTAVGGTAEAIVDGQNGCLVPPGSRTALSEAILKVLRMNPVELADMGSHGSALLQSRFSADVSTAKVLHFYAQLLSERSDGRGRNV